MTAGEALRAIEDGHEVDQAAAEWLRELGLAAKRKGGWALTKQGRARLAPAPEDAPMEDAPREEIAARLPPQPDSPSPTALIDAG